MKQPMKINLRTQFPYQVYGHFVKQEDKLNGFLGYNEPNNANKKLFRKALL